jgi:hypothetical protein
MVSGKRIPDELSWTCVRMHQDGYDKKKIRRHTAVSERQQRRLLECWRRTGVPYKPHVKPPGRRRLVGLTNALVGLLYTC